jgi:hypothetical protein
LEKLTTPVNTNLDDKSPEQKRLIETIMMLPATTLEDETLQYNAAINAFTAYCKIEEGGSSILGEGQPDLSLLLRLKLKKTLIP